MADKDIVVEEWGALREAQIGTLVKRLSRIEPVTRGRIKGPVGKDPPTYLDGAVAGDRAGSALGCRGGFTADSLLSAVGRLGLQA